MKKTRTSLMLFLALCVSLHGFCLPKLNSLPDAAATIYLDFDGEEVNCAYWNSGQTLLCAPAGFDDAQIIEIFNRVAEDFRPFSINITTDGATYIAAPLNNGMRVIVTSTSGWYAGVGGASFTGSFTWGDDTPSFVFSDRLGPNSPKMVAECCSHESGHALGLTHQSTYDGTCRLTATYNEGTGSGVNAWAPIMGNSYYRNMSGWNNGPTPYGCENNQDNISTITSQNGFSLREDDHRDSNSVEATTLVGSGDAISGVIASDRDKDVFRISLPGNASLHILARPFGINSDGEGANLDIKLLLYNGQNELLRTYDPAERMDVLIDTFLSTGTYYLAIDGTGNSNTEDYGSLGSYTISAIATAVLPIREMVLQGQVKDNMHQLNWRISSAEPVKQIIVETSTDGVHFKSCYTGAATISDAKYKPMQHTDLYYRVKAVTILNQVFYSNTLKLKAAWETTKAFRVSTLVRDQLTVTAGIAYHYQLFDMGGNKMLAGTGSAGFSSLDMSRYPAGMYVPQLANNNDKQTERIIKQ